MLLDLMETLYSMAPKNHEVAPILIGQAIFLR